jgi:hypothetical protein
MTVDYNSSHIEPLLNNACLTNLYEESLLISHYFESESYVTTDGQSASLFWNKAPIWGLWPDSYYCQTVAGLSMCGALSSYDSQGYGGGIRPRLHMGLLRIFESTPFYIRNAYRI